MPVNEILFHNISVNASELLLAAVIKIGFDIIILSKFNEYLEAGQVYKVTFTNTKATVFLKKEALSDKKHEKVYINFLDFTLMLLS